MRGLKKKRRIQIVVAAFVALAAAGGLVGFAFKDGINLFRSPSQIVSDPPRPNEVFKVGGLVEEGSLIEGQGETITFRITDGAETIAVSYTGIRPDLFSEGQGTIATGTFTDGVFVATEILAKHDETYMPKEVVDALKEQGVYKDPGES